MIGCAWHGFLSVKRDRFGLGTGTWHFRAGRHSISGRLPQHSRANSPRKPRARPMECGRAGNGSDGAGCHGTGCDSPVSPHSRPSLISVCARLPPPSPPAGAAPETRGLCRQGIAPRGSPRVPKGPDRATPDQRAQKNRMKPDKVSPGRPARTRNRPAQTWRASDDFQSPQPAGIAALFFAGMAPAFVPAPCHGLNSPCPGFPRATAGNNQA